MKRVRVNLTYANVMVTILAFVVLAGGTAYAASEMLPKNSVGSKQIKKEAVTPAKLSKAAKATLTGPKGETGATGAPGLKGDRGEPGPATGAAGGALAGNYPNPTLATQPVVATGYSAGTTTILETCTHYSGAEVTIDAPSSGKVVVTANIVLNHSHSVGVPGYVLMGVQESSSTCEFRTGEDAINSVPSAASAFSEARTTIPATKTFDVTAGTHTYYLNGEKGESDLQQFYFAALTAIFIPS